MIEPKKSTFVERQDPVEKLGRNGYVAARRVRALAAEARRLQELGVFVPKAERPSKSALWTLD